MFVCAVTQTCPTLSWTVACQALLSRGFSRQEYWSGLPFPSPGDHPDWGIKPMSPVFTGRLILYHWATWEVELNIWTRIVINHIMYALCYDLWYIKYLVFIPVSGTMLLKSLEWPDKNNTGVFHYVNKVILESHLRLGAGCQGSQPGD